MNIDIENENLIIIATSTLFICKICIPEWSDLFYKGSLSTQSWHNSTYTLMRPFSMLSLYYYFKIKKNYINNIKIKDLLLFTLFLSITNYSKPNFIIAFAPVMLLFLIKDFILTKTKSFKNAFIFGVCVLVSCFVLIYQYKFLFGTKSENKIAFSIFNLIQYFNLNRKFVIYFILSFAYPLYILFLSIKNWKYIDNYSKYIYKFMWITYLISFLESLVLMEDGPRYADGNFLWGPQLFAYLLFLISIAMQFKLTKEKKISQNENCVANYTYVLHIIYGISYFVLLCMGYYYYF